MDGERIMFIFIGIVFDVIIIACVIALIANIWKLTFGESKPTKDDLKLEVDMLRQKLGLPTKYHGRWF